MVRVRVFEETRVKVFARIPYQNFRVKNLRELMILPSTLIY